MKERSTFYVKGFSKISKLRSRGQDSQLNASLEIVVSLSWAHETSELRICKVEEGAAKVSLSEIA